MKIKIKKVIVGVVLATAMIVPTVASAANGYLTYDIVGKYNYETYGTADYTHHVVHVNLMKGWKTTYGAGWEDADTPPIYGLNSNSIVNASAD